MGYDFNGTTAALGLGQLTRYMQNACSVERLSDLRNLALTKDCCVA